LAKLVAKLLTKSEIYISHEIAQLLIYLHTILKFLKVKGAGNDWKESYFNVIAYYLA